MIDFAVGDITDEARAAVESIGGTIAPVAGNSSILVVFLPDDARIADSGGTWDIHCAYIELPAPSTTTLKFTHGWNASDCSLDVWVPQGLSAVFKA